MQQTVLDFSATIANRTRDFIDGWLLADPDGSRYFIITGKSSIGKTAIAAWPAWTWRLAAVA